MNGSARNNHTRSELAKVGCAPLYSHIRRVARERDNCTSGFVVYSAIPLTWLYS